MNRAERIFRIHRLLKTSRRPVTMGQLTKEFECHRSSVVRDIAYMRDYMGAPIVFRQEDNGYRYDPAAPEFELPGLWFNAEELYALLASEQLLEAVQPGLLSPYIKPLRARIRKLLEHNGYRSETVTHRIRIKPTAIRPVDPERFSVLASAVLQGHPLVITYHGRGRDAVTERQVHPYRLLHYRNNWYLVAWCDMAGSLRVFALDRVRTATRSDKPLRHGDDAELDHFLNASFGIFTGPAQERAILHFTAAAARWVADEIWHPEQVAQWHGDVYELQIPYADPRELIMEILKYGADVEVMGPESLREAVAERLAAASARYEKVLGVGEGWSSG